MNSEIQPGASWMMYFDVVLDSTGAKPTCGVVPTVARVVVEFILFLRLHPERLPYYCSEPEAATFLEHLVLKRKVVG